MKKTIRLSESELHRLIKESVKRALSEGEAWANQPPIDEFHPDWWYYRQEVEPEGLEDFDPCMDLSDEEYDERLKQKFGESKLRRVIKENEAYNQFNKLQRFAYENQQIRPMVQKLADFSENVAQIGKMIGKDNYYQFYHKLHGDILEMHNLWGFLDDSGD